MKTIRSYLLLLSIMTVYAACNDDSYHHFTLVTPPDTMELTTLQTEDIVLNEDLNNEVALTFEWKAAADRGEGTAITYFFKMDIANNNFASSIPKIEVSAEQRSISFTHKELNDLITNVWKVHPGDAVELEAEVIADVTTYPQYLKPEISKKIVNVTSYILKPRDLFLLGTATENEDPQKAIKLSTLTINKEYTWTGNMKPGTFKFVEELGKLLPSYNKGKDNNTLVHRTEESAPDELFTVDKEGMYAIYVNIEDMKVTCTPVPYPEVYMVGNATPANWEMNNAILMQWDYVQGAYVYEGELYAGEMKLPLKKDWNYDTLMPVEAGANPLEDKRVELVVGADPDKKWNIAEDGNYRMILDVNAMTITLKKL